MSKYLCDTLQQFNALAKNIILNVFERLLLSELQEYSIHSKRGSVPASQILCPSETIVKSPKKKAPDVHGCQAQ